ncbi:MAG: hypothetical protein ABSC48_11760 [Terracidiphilus sp.]
MAITAWPSGRLGYTDAPERLHKGLAHHPVPVMLLARLAVDKNWQKKGWTRTRAGRRAAHHASR